MLPKKILVPFPFESSLSGIRELPENHYMWYRRTLSVPAGKQSSGGRVILKFEAVDWQTEVYISGQKIGTHSGGYDAFEFDITEVSDLPCNVRRKGV